MLLPHPVIVLHLPAVLGLVPSAIGEYLLYLRHGFSPELVLALAISL